jgi:hypothetical protein
MKPVIVNQLAEIIDGTLQGKVGKVVAFDVDEGEVLIMLPDKKTFVNVSPSMIFQKAGPTI